MLRNDDRNRKIRENRFKTRKLGLLDFSGTHRGTRWPNGRNYSDTRQASRGFGSRNPSRFEELRLEGSHLKLEDHHHHHFAARIYCLESLEAVLAVILAFLKH
ncbi:hypothetical protein E3N88_20055 [Mikania micrantha]|uniref:Uncharacterized protein n=1 Tax=Mikania micrantha TaxID=192012 RepID=A0A5N6NG11_9ASTR|nr:hypothetical protein E3N88_20055 [Mikania micrantha]